MKATATFAALALGTALLTSTAHAQEVERLITNPDSPFAAAVTVPPGFTTYYIAGMTPSVANANAPKGSIESYGDISEQTRSVLNNIKASLTKLGLTFGDVVQAHVFMTPDPSKNGDIDFAGMNKVWLTEFGTAAQPNKPSRVTVKVAGLAAPGALIEIEMTAAKKK